MRPLVLNAPPEEEDSAVLQHVREVAEQLIQMLPATNPAVEVPPEVDDAPQQTRPAVWIALVALAVGLLLLSCWCDGCAERQRVRRRRKAD